MGGGNGKGPFFCEKKKGFLRAESLRRQRGEKE